MNRPLNTDPVFERVPSLRLSAWTANGTLLLCDVVVLCEHNPTIAAVLYDDDNPATSVTVTHQDGSTATYERN